MPTISLSKQRLVDLFLNGKPSVELDKMTSDFHGRRLIQERSKYYAEKEFDSIFQKMFENTGLKIGATYKVRTYMNPDVDCDCILQHYVPGSRDDRCWLDLMFKSVKGNNDIWTGLNFVNGGYIISVNGDNISKVLMHEKGVSDETDRLINEISDLNWNRVRQIETTREVTAEIQRMTGIRFGKTVCRFSLNDSVCEAVLNRIIMGNTDGFTLYVEYTGDCQPSSINEEEIQSVTWK